MRPARLSLALIPLFLGLVAHPASAFPISKNYADIKAFLTKVVADHPQNAELFVLGDSDSGEKIIGIKAGNGPVNNLVVGTHHGNEYGSTEVAKAFAQSVAEQPIAGETMYVIPVLNINGFDRRDRYEVNAAGESVDPAEYYFRISGVFETAAPQYAWLNRILAVGTGHRPPTGPVYSVFEVL